MKTLEETFALTKRITVYCTSTAAKYLAIYVTVFEKMMSCRRTQAHKSHATVHFEEEWREKLT